MASEEAESDESLIALTTHFAQVQFRLKQIISADVEHKEELLKDLEKFAFQGCGKAMTYDTAASDENGSTEAQRQIRIELMEKLQTQLDDIERCAQEATLSGGVASKPDPEAAPEASAVGAHGGVVNAMMEKQRIIIEELRKRFDFQFGDLEGLSAEEVKESVGRAVRDVVDPIRSKEEYVTHLQSQIKDLERYISFLQTKQSSTPQSPRSHDLSSREATPPVVSAPHSYRPHPKALSLSGAGSKPKKHVTFAREEWDGLCDEPPTPQYRLSMAQLDGVECTVDSTKYEWEKMDSFGRELYNPPSGPDDLRLSLSVMRKTLAVMEVLTLCQCGGSLHCLPKYVADGKRKRYHMALQSLEMAVDKISIISTALHEEGLAKENKVSLETDLHETVSMLLADSLRVLVEHGLLANGKPVSLTDGCLPAWSNWGFSGRGLDVGSGECPAWRVFSHYYKMKNGQKFSCRTDQLLSSSFGLEVDSSSVKKTLLSSVNKVTQAYGTSYHHSKDIKFRALVCEGFNVCHLSEWFKIIASNPSIADDLYTSSSFLVTTGFRPAIACLERLKDNPTCEPLSLPHNFYQFEDAFLRA